MTGKECVAIACDKRLGMEAMTVSMNFPKVFPVHQHLFYGLSGLATDVLTVSEELRYKVDLYKLGEDRQIDPAPFANLLSSLLYEKRFGPFFINPVVAGLDVKSNKPFVASTDSIGCLEISDEFAVIGTSTPSLYGMCEALWQPGLEPDQLFECISQALLNSLDRDALSGWGAVVYIITKDSVVKKTLKARQD